MKAKQLIILSLISLICFGSAVAQDGEKQTVEKSEKAKKGLSLGGVPAIAYDSDTGFKYGLILNFFHYGDGTIYPFYKHSLYLEWSHTTKGNDLKQLKYDSEYLIPGIRVIADARLETEQAMDFYGFNGFNTLFNPALSTVGSDDYISRMFYRMDRSYLRLRTNFQGKLIGRQLRWFAGVSHYNVSLGSVDVDRLNKGKDEADLLPKVDGLYDIFVKENIIPEDEATGGGVTSLTAGLVFDTRDNEPNPNRGIWTEAMLVTSPGFIGNKHPYTTMVLTHRQYFTIFPDRLTFAYRLNYQTTIGGQIPWYMLSYTIGSTENQNGEGLGGSKNLRGVMRNRVVGEGFALGNFELRWKFAKFSLLNQNFYLALSPFLDVARITKPYSPYEGFAIPEAFYGTTDGFHVSYGAGLHIALNQNFIVAADYGIAHNTSGDRNDGTKGLYIGLNFLF